MFTIILTTIIYYFNKKELKTNYRSWLEQFMCGSWIFVWEIGMILLFILK